MILNMLVLGLGRIICRKCAASEASFHSQNSSWLFGCAFVLRLVFVHLSFTPPVPALISLKSVAMEGTEFASYERNTWPELERLARDVPEAGIHFQGMVYIFWQKRRDGMC